MSRAVGSRSTSDGSVPPELRECIRNAYVSERRRHDPDYVPSRSYDGGYDRLGRRRRPVWDRIAVRLMAAGITDQGRACRYVIFCMRECGVLYADALCNRRLIDEFLDHEKSELVRRQEQIISEMAGVLEAVRGPGNREVLRAALYSGQPYSTTMARCLLARLLGEDDAYRRLTAELRMEADREPELYGPLSDVIRSFVSEAITVCSTPASMQ